MSRAESALILRGLFDQAVAAADPMLTIARALPAKPSGRVVVVGAGKASARMAEAVEQSWGPCDGLVITRYGYGRPCRGIRIVEAAHPVPDIAGYKASCEMLELVEGLGADDFVLALISGGGSALLAAPAGEITLDDLQQVNAALLASGAPIDQMNKVRKHLSNIAGGQLAARVYPARLLCLMISDVPGDDPALIASGPTVGDGSSGADAAAVLAKWGIKPPRSVASWLAQPTGVLPLGHRRLSRCTNRIISAPAQSLEAAASSARGQHFDVRVLGDALEGEARILGAEHGSMLIELQRRMRAGQPPLVVLSGGECTVSKRGGGIGGPNAEYALSAAIALNGQAGISLIACDTDGVDGGAEIAGALVHPQTLARAREAGVDGKRALQANDSHSFFAAINDQVVTGPTLTNVNDFRAALVFAPDT